MNYWAGVFLKTIEKSILVGFLLTIIFSCFGFFSKCENINDKILRLHILANSDSEEDQNLKLKVRDKILEYSKAAFEKAKTKEDAKQLLSQNLDEIKILAQNEVKKHGYEYPIEVNLNKAYFTTRRYENFTLPAGKYDAIKVLIGKAQGRNWWCVMFPALCFGSALEEIEEDLEAVLDVEEVDIVENEYKYEFKFKIVEIFISIKDWLEELFDF